MNIAGSTTLIINGNKYEASENVEQTKQASEYRSDKKENGISHDKVSKIVNNISMLALSTVSIIGKATLLLFSNLFLNPSSVCACFWYAEK